MIAKRFELDTASKSHVPPASFVDSLARADRARRRSFGASENGSSSDRTANHISRKQSDGDHSPIEKILTKVAFAALWNRGEQAGMLRRELDS